MIFDQASDSQMQAARIFGGAAMVGFLAAPVFRGQARRIRVAVAALYIAGIVGFTVYVLY